MRIELTFTGKPNAVQSFRFTKAGKKYQPSEVINWKNFIKLQAMQQFAGEPFPADIPLGIQVEFIFTAPKSLKKSYRQAIANGATVYKVTKPDLTDNLKKGLIDALSGIIWERDQQIARESSVKRYGLVAKTILTVESLHNPESVVVPAQQTFGW